jgi:hypothetical protein
MFRLNHPNYYHEFIRRHPDYEIERDKKPRRKAEHHRNYVKRSRGPHREEYAEKEENRLGTTNFGPHMNPEESRERQIVSGEIRRLRLTEFIREARRTGFEERPNNWEWKGPE